MTRPAYALCYSLAALYDGDRRTKDPVAAEAAGRLRVPHPLSDVQYADGRSSAHAGRHHRLEAPRPWTSVSLPAAPR